MKLTKTQIAKIGASIKVAYAKFMAFIEVESNGKGFSELTGKLIIQFEPSYFKKTYEEWKSCRKDSVWLNNAVGDQVAEWKAFNDAYKLDPEAAMQSCSIGMGQVMGYHYALLGFKTVNDMWDFAKGWDPVSQTYDKLRGEYNQVVLIARFVSIDPVLLHTLQKEELTIDDCDTLAKHYNGWGYKELALKLGREPYDKTIYKAYEKYLITQPTA